MKQRLDFFSHQADAWDGPEFSALRTHYPGEAGWAMEARYYALCGIIARSDGVRLNVSLTMNRGYLQRKLGLDDAGLTEFLTVITSECGLAVLAGDILSIPSVTEDLARVEEASQAASKRARRRWDKGGPPAEGEESEPSPDAQAEREDSPGNAQAMQQHCTGNAEAMQGDKTRETRGDRRQERLSPLVDLSCKSARAREEAASGKKRERHQTEPPLRPDLISKRKLQEQCSQLGDHGHGSAIERLFEWARKGIRQNPCVWVEKFSMAGGG